MLNRCWITEFFKHCFFLISFMLASLQINAESFSEIRMSSENIKIIIDNNKAYVHVSFNYSGQFEIPNTIAFPETYWYFLDNFKVYFNNSILKTKKVKAPLGRVFIINNDSYPSIYSFSFPPDKSIYNNAIVTYSYKLKCHIPSNKDLYDNKENFTGKYIEYILKTGAPWKDTIGSIHAEIIFSNNKCEDITNFTDGYVGKCINSRTWVLDKKDIEPTKNIRLLLKDSKCKL